MFAQSAMKPLFTIKPRGWLRRQLQLQANGLAGNLDKIWPDVRDSKWIGGDKEGWERVPYWLDGFVPLAYLLEDEDLKARAKRYIDAILARQNEDGWICPCSKEERANYDTWAALLITKVLAQYGDYSGDARIADALYRCYRQLDEHLDRHTLRTWGAARWYEGLIGLLWLYERRPEPWMLTLADKLHFQGFDCEQILSSFVPNPPENRWTLQTHVVNLAMCLKQEALYSRFTGKPCGNFAARALETLLKHHGQAHGYFSGDECLAGTSPIRGTELCGVVEAMYSYEQLLFLTGDPVWGDELERLAFNALPAACSADMWSHQYDQQINQVRCEPLPKEHIIFGTNGVDSHRFGLEPNYGCCTANMGQGWPKLAASAVAEMNCGLALCLPLPLQAEATMNGVSVRLTVETEYPFRDEITVHVAAASPVSFPLFLRIPSSAGHAVLDGKSVPCGQFECITRTWSGESVLHLHLSPRPNWTTRPNGLRCLWRGPLLFALPIAETWTRCEAPDAQPPRIYPYCDYSIAPAAPWNYAFCAEAGEVQMHPIPDMPFDTQNPALAIVVPMVQIPWKEEYGVAKPLPDSLKPCATPEQKRLIPYGATQLRMTEMPLV